MNRLMISVTLLLLILLGSSLSQAGPLEVGVVLDLLKVGLSEESIKSYIGNNRFYFEPVPSELEALKEAGASDELILFVQERTRQNMAPAPRTGSGSEDPDRSRGAADTVPEEYQDDYFVGYVGPEYIPTYSYGVYLSYPYFYGSPYYWGPYYYPYYGPYYGGYYYSSGHHRHSGRVSHGGSRVRSNSGRSRSSGTMNRSSGSSSHGSGRGRRR